MDGTKAGPAHGVQALLEVLKQLGHLRLGAGHHPWLLHVAVVRAGGLQVRMGGRGG